MNRATTLSLFNSQAKPFHLRTSLFHSTPVLDRRRRTHWDSGNTSKINFCQLCGGPTKHDIPDGDEKMRAVCTLCGKIAYENPKMDSSIWFLGAG